MVIALLLFAFVMSLIKEFVDKVVHNKQPDRQSDKVIEHTLKESE